MASYLEDLETNLLRDSPATVELVSAWLSEHMITFQHMAYSLAEHIPCIITLPCAFNPDASENFMAALLEDIAERVCVDNLRTPSSTDVFGGIISRRHRRRRTCAGSPTRARQSGSQFTVLVFAATVIAKLWRGNLARRRAENLRNVRDAIFIIKQRTTHWLLRRRRQPQVAQLASTPAAVPALPAPATILEGVQTAAGDAGYVGATTAPSTAHMTLRTEERPPEHESAYKMVTPTRSYNI